MAGDWIKMRSDLRRHPKVVRMASALDADKYRIVGGLHAVWCLFDEQTEDGFLYGYTLAALDQEINFPGFSAAMVDIGWLEIEPGEGLRAPEFDEHNGQSAKRRAQETKRKRIERAEAEKAEKDGRKPSAPDADKKRTREDKREEDKSPKPPRGRRGAAKQSIEEPPGFVRFWAGWPPSKRKEGRGKCAEIWVSAGLEAEADEINAHVEAKLKHTDWTADGGKYVEAPSVYLNHRKWDGAELPGSARASTSVLFPGAI